MPFVFVENRFLSWIVSTPVRYTVGVDLGGPGGDHSVMAIRDNKTGNILCERIG